jgi:signal transduction histidine kinase
MGAGVDESSVVSLMVDLVGVVRELAGECEEMLENRWVRLIVQAGFEVVAVRGSGVRVRLMLEHLLNNAMEALGDQGGEIRMTVDRVGEKVHLIVSDTGPGFREPGRVFEVGRPGMGLNVCREIVREMGGEIWAFNLHPHGAAVAVELPGF